MNTGGPAFPLAASTGDPRDGVYCQNGMSLLDYMAGQALVGYVAHNGVSGNFNEHADQCYDIASAMLAEKARRERDSDSGIRTAQSDDGATVEFVIADSSTGKRMAALEALNRELVWALEECELHFACYDGDPKYPANNSTLKTVCSILAKAKEVA